MPEEVVFQTKPQLALGLIDRAIANGVKMSAWTFDELYGRDRKFLDGLEQRGQLFVAEIPLDFRGWLEKPTVVQPPKTAKKRGRKRRLPRVARRPRASRVRDLLRHSPVFRDQSWQRYRTNDTDRGPNVWEVKWAPFYRPDARGVPTRRHVLIVARNVLTEEVKFFLANRVSGERHLASGERITLRGLLRVAFGRWPVESCLRETKEELGLDHCQCRSWSCVQRHMAITRLNHLYCARVRQEYDQATAGAADGLTIEQVRSAMDVWLDAADLPRAARQARYQKEIDQQLYYQTRSESARNSHTHTRRRELAALGIDADRIKSCLH